MADNELKLADQCDVKDKATDNAVKDSTEATETCEEATSTLALKLQRLTVKCSSRSGKAQRLTSEECKARLTSEECKARLTSEERKAKKSAKLQEDKAKVFGDSYSQNLHSFSKISLDADKEDEKSHSGETFQSYSRLSGCSSAGKRKRSTTPESDLPTQNPNVRAVSCGEQVRLLNDINPDDLAGYLEVTTFFPKKMSYMAELMYT